jgi:hypothetical protein
MMYDINWDASFYPLYGSTISIPTSTVIWRGFDPTYPAVSNRPAYYGALKVAQGYAQKYGTDASAFITTKYLNVLDIRYMKTLLSQLFESNPITEADRDIFMATTISFGLCSYAHQITLFDERYAKIYKSSDSSYDDIKMGIQHMKSLLQPKLLREQRGIRIAETSNDAIVMGFIKEIFGDNYDGWIAPSQETPFHIEKRSRLHSELVLFNPADSGIRLLDYVPTGIKKTHINEMILNRGVRLHTIDTSRMRASYYDAMGGSNLRNSNTDVCDDYNHLIDKGDEYITSLYNKGRKDGMRWKHKKPVKLLCMEALHPRVDPSIFENSSSGGLLLS